MTNRTLKAAAAIVLSATFALSALCGCQSPQPETVETADVVETVSPPGIIRERVSLPFEVDKDRMISGGEAPSNAVTMEWYKGKLGSPAKEQMYATMLAAMKGLYIGVKVHGMSEGDVVECFWAVLYDHPEIFWIGDAYSCVYDKRTGEVVAFDFEYLYGDHGEIEKRLHDYELIADAVIRGTYPPQTPFNATVKAYDWICANTSYDGVQHALRMPSLFSEKVASAEGYAQALQFIALRAGAACTRVSGEATGEGAVEGDNTWVVAVYGDKLLYFDPVLDDSATVTSTAFCGINYDEFSGSHRLSSEKAPISDGARNDAKALYESAVVISSGKRYEMMPSESESIRSSDVPDTAEGAADG